MDGERQVAANKARNEDTKDSQKPRVRVARSGTLYIELEDLVPYFLPTEEEIEEQVRGYIKEAEEKVPDYIKKHEKEVRSYIKEARANMGKIKNPSTGE
jgi:hypothetical protein